MRRVQFWMLLAILAAAVAVAVVARRGNRVGGPAVDHRRAAEELDRRIIGRMVALPGGTFQMGDDLSPEPDARPAHTVRLSPFRIDEHEVTNGQFAAFVQATGYVTTAEQRGWSLVWDEELGHRVETPGADWRHPGGPYTRIDGRDRYPVVHVSWYDAVAYCRWANKRLPTEAEWEYAARSGLRDGNFPWGNDELVGGRYRANYRQHGRAIDADGFARLAPVKSYPASAFGLYDMCGNVAEWCADWYAADYYGTGPRHNPPGPAEGTERVVRGGSWVSPEEYRADHHVAARSRYSPDITSDHIGFRAVRARSHAVSPQQPTTR